MKNALEVEDLTVYYGKTPVLWDLSFSLPAQALSGIAGPNGGGKSTLLKAAMGLVKPLSGKILFKGEPLASARKKIAYVPQRESVDWDFPITVFDVVLMGRYPRFGFWKRPTPADREAAHQALEQVGMAPYANRQISELSGGQQQRVFLARALVQDPDLFLMDEPFSGVDLATEEAILELLVRLKARGKAAAIVFHDLDIAERYFDHLILINRRLVASGKPADLALSGQLFRPAGNREALFEEATLLCVKTTQGIR